MSARRGACILTVAILISSELTKLSIHPVQSVSVDIDPNGVVHDERYRMGKERYELWQKETKMPRYSQCWTVALKQLNAGCKDLTDDVQHRLALQFTNCFSQKTGRQVYMCSSHQILEDCTKDMLPEVYNTYVEFFTHTQNICFFLQAQIWQDETEQTITRLADSSANVAQQIEDSSQVQGEIMKRQNESIQNQELLLERGHELKKTIEDSAVDVHKMLVEFKETTTEQRAMIYDVFDRVHDLRTLVMGEFTGFYSLIFYTISVLISYLLTSTPRTSGARFWLFALMTVNMILERLLVACCSTDSSLVDGQIVDSSTIMYSRLWWCRKLFCVAAVGTWLWFAYKYKDFNHLNNQLLVEIKKQNSDLKHLLQANQTPSLPAKPLFLGNGVPPVALLGIGPVNVMKDGCGGMDTGDSFCSEGDESDSDSSSDSGTSDRTFAIDEYSDESDQESFMTTDSGRGSRASTPCLLDELRYLRSSTPLREMSPGWDTSFSDNSFISPSNASTTTKRKPGRPRGSKSRPSLLPSFERRSKSGRYNLRQKNPAAPAENPAVQSESAEDFGRMVKNLAKVAMRNTMRTRYTVQQMKPTSVGRPAFFSSDED